MLTSQLRSLAATAQRQRCSAGRPGFTVPPAGDWDTGQNTLQLLLPEGGVCPHPESGLL